MPFELPTYYPHRRNKDGSFTSVCLKCFQNVAEYRTEEDLQVLDKAHVCTDSALSRRTPRASLTSSR
jgi:hypothetical protein